MCQWIIFPMLLLQIIRYRFLQNRNADMHRFLHFVHFPALIHLGLCRMNSVSAMTLGMDGHVGRRAYSRVYSLVAGTTGTGKTTFGLQFLAEGASLGEQGLLISFEERPGKIQRLASACGLNVAGGVKSGKIRIMHRPVSGLFLEEFLSDVEQEVASKKPQRVVVDGLTDIGLAVEPQSKMREAVWALSSVLEPAQATVLMTSEIPDVVGQFSITDQHLSVLVDGIILLRYVEIDGEMQRAVSVLKMRGTDHDKNIRRFTTGDAGLEVGAMFEGHEGILGDLRRRATLPCRCFP